MNTTANEFYEIMENHDIMTPVDAMEAISFVSGVLMSEHSHYEKEGDTRKAEQIHEIVNLLDNMENAICNL